MLTAPKPATITANGLIHGSIKQFHVGVYFPAHPERTGLCRKCTIILESLDLNIVSRSIHTSPASNWLLPHGKEFVAK